MMCEMTADLPAIEAAHGLAPGTLRPAPDAVAPLIADGLAAWDGAALRATAPGRPFLRCVAALFDANLGKGAGRHARAV
jgi:oxygen-independent coproporphyrinogen-3 oxidase